MVSALELFKDGQPDDAQQFDFLIKFAKIPTPELRAQAKTAYEELPNNYGVDGGNPELDQLLAVTEPFFSQPIN